MERVERNRESGVEIVKAEKLSAVYWCEAPGEWKNSGEKER